MLTRADVSTQPKPKADTQPCVLLRLHEEIRPRLPITVQRIMNIKKLAFAIGCFSALMACQSNKLLPVPEEMFSDKCSAKSTETLEVPYLLKNNTVDENKYFYTVHFNSNCSYDFLAHSSKLWSFEEFYSVYWNADPFIAFPQTGEYIASVDKNDVRSMQNIYILDTLGAENTRSVVFQGSAIMINERKNLGFMR